jgi:hypothetical protein
MSTEDFIKGLVAGLGGATGIWEIFHRLRVRRSQKKVLTRLLTDNPKYGYGRTFRILKSVVGDDKKAEEILLAMGAHRNPKTPPGTDPDDVIWTLNPLE